MISPRLAFSSSSSFWRLFAWLVRSLFDNSFARSSIFSLHISSLLVSSIPLHVRGGSWLYRQDSNFNCAMIKLTFPKSLSLNAVTRASCESRRAVSSFFLFINNLFLYYACLARKILKLDKRQRAKLIH